MRRIVVALLFLIVRLIPGSRPKAFVVNFFGVAAGFILAPFLINRWRPLAALGRDVRPGMPSFIFAYRCLVRAGRDHMWGYLFTEHPEAVPRFLTEGGVDFLRTAEKDKSGAIILGVHYGPMLNHVAFRTFMGGRQALVMISSSTEENILNKTKANRYAVAGRQERLIVQEMQAGGFVIILDDLPKHDTGGVEMSVAGRKGHLNGFPFKLALKYSIPVFYCVLADAAGGGYKWVVTKAPPFATTAEGVADYVEWIDGLVSENPYMWHGARFYSV